MGNKPSKWKKVTDKLPRAVEEPERQDKINAVKTAIFNTAPISAKEEETTFKDLEILTIQTCAVISEICQHLIDVNGGRNYAATYARAWAEYRQIRDAIEEAMKQLSLIGEAYAQMVDSQYEAEGITNMKLDGLGSVRVQVEPWASIANPDVFREWCLENDLKNKLTLLWQTTNAITKEFLERGDNPPPGIKVWSKPKLFFTRG